jgi:hypothetical protein
VPDPDNDRATDPAYLCLQYGDTERLRIPQQTHRQYSERPDDFLDWTLDQLEPKPGDLVLDVGCGDGGYHRALAARGVRAIVGWTRRRPWCAPLSSRHPSTVCQSWPSMVTPSACRFRPLRTTASWPTTCCSTSPTSWPRSRSCAERSSQGGRVLLVTNAADHSARLCELHAAAAEELDYTPAAPVGARFTLDHLPLVQRVFPTVERRVRPDAFVFPTAEAALRYYASATIDAIRDPPADGVHRQPLLALLQERIEAIIQIEGVFRVPKDAGCFVADV